MAKTVVVAPPSRDYVRKKGVQRIKDLRNKQGRSAAETKDLVDNLVALLPPGTLD